MKCRGERGPPGPEVKVNPADMSRAAAAHSVLLNIVTSVSPTPALSRSHERCELLRESGLVSLRPARWRLTPLVPDLRRQREADL